MSESPELFGKLCNSTRGLDLFAARHVDPGHGTMAGHTVLVIAELEGTVCLHLRPVPSWDVSARPGRFRRVKAQAAATTARPSAAVGSEAVLAGCGA